MLPALSHSLPSSEPAATIGTSPRIEIVLPIKPAAVKSSRLPMHPMQTRSKDGIFKPKSYAVAVTDLGVDLVNSECSSVTQALQSPHWKQATCEEYDALMKNLTWSLVPFPSNAKAIGCKCIFYIKRNPNGSSQKYKARLVAKGFHQREGLDFGEVFSPMVKPSTVRIMLTIALSKGWTIRQFDSNNAFLNGELSEVVYMTQPEGFTIGSNMICSL